MSCAHVLLACQIRACAVARLSCKTVYMALKTKPHCHVAHMAQTEHLRLQPARTTVTCIHVVYIAHVASGMPDFSMA